MPYVQPSRIVVLKSETALESLRDAVEYCINNDTSFQIITDVRGDGTAFVQFKSGGFMWSFPYYSEEHSS